jgi:ATP/maltotriose-dependent transcriptional regulator MalT
VELALGRGAAELGRLDAAIYDLETAAQQADRAGARGFVAEARYHLATALAGRNGPGDRDRALSAARDAHRLAKALGMAAYVERTGALVAHLGGDVKSAALSAREAEVAKLVAEGLTNRQIRRAAGDLRTHCAEPRAAHPHEARLHDPEPDPGLDRRRGQMSSEMSHPADGRIASNS